MIEKEDPMQQTESPLVAKPSNFLKTTDDSPTLTRKTAIEMADFGAWYGDFQALRDLTLAIPEKRVTALHRSQRLRQEHAAQVD